MGIQEEPGGTTYKAKSYNFLMVEWRTLHMEGFITIGPPT